MSWSSPKPTDEAIAEIRLRSPQGVVEIGAGSGHWGEVIQQVGIPWVGYDIVPGGPLVMEGDHLMAARHSARAMLAVGPPDGGEIQRWIEAYRGDTMLICANHRRLDFDDALDGWDEVSVVRLPDGSSEMKVWIRT